MENKLRTKECNKGVKYDDLTNVFRSTLDSPSPLKQKQVMGNQVLFMTIELSKAIMTSLGLRANTINGHPEKIS